MKLALCGLKGGVSKSTTAICIATEAQTRGKSVLLVDADQQATVRTWGEVASEQGRVVPTIVAMGATMHRPDQLPRLSRDFDLTIIDCPPRIDAVQRSALMVADVALLPCGASPADAWALASTLELVREAQILRRELFAYVFMTRIQRATALGRGARAVLSGLGIEVLDAELGYRVTFQEALAAGQGASTYQPTSDAAIEVRRLTTEIFEHETRHSSAQATSA